MENLRPKSAPISLSVLRDFGPDFEKHKNTFVTGITQDSNSVKPGDLFVALAGANTHGAIYSKQALNSGAVAILTDEAGSKLIAEPAVPILELTDLRSKLGEISGLIYQNPSKKLKVFGITGTNGKTTTSWLLHGGLERAGIKTALFGTAGIKIGDIFINSERTTPEAPQLQAMLALAVEMELSAVVMEVSSHAIALNRIDGIWFESVGFTNLSQDHLDFHGTMEEYFKVKQKLFTERFSSKAFICESDSWSQRLIRECKIARSTIGTSTTSEWKLTNIGPALGHVDFDVMSPNKDNFNIQLEFAGSFNALNAALALAMVDRLEIDKSSFIKGMSKTHIPGRMEPVLESGKALAIVDYAHTPEAIESVISTLRQQTNGRVIAVLGAGGNRDSQKRSLMGKAVSAADIVIITDDNPRFEDPNVIRKAIISAISDESKVREIADRKAAIYHAVEISNESDTIVILGKGHEEYQEIRDEKIPFSDTQVISQALKQRD